MLFEWLVGVAVVVGAADMREPGASDELCHDKMGAEWCKQMMKGKEGE
jgi:hypothetical protein